MLVASSGPVAGLPEPWLPSVRPLLAFEACTVPREALRVWVVLEEPLSDRRCMRGSAMAAASLMSQHCPSANWLDCRLLSAALLCKASSAAASSAMRCSRCASLERSASPALLAIL